MILQCDIVDEVRIDSCHTITSFTLHRPGNFFFFFFFNYCYSLISCELSILLVSHTGRILRTVIIPILPVADSILQAFVHLGICGVKSIRLKHGIPPKVRWTSSGDYLTGCAPNKRDWLGIYACRSDDKSDHIIH